MKTLLLLLTILFMLVLGWFIGSQNSHVVFINYLLAETEIRMSVLLAISFFSGVLLAFCLVVLYIAQLKWQVASLERKLKKLSQPSTNA